MALQTMVARSTEPDRAARSAHRARRLRREPSLGERKMWEALRDRRFDGLKFRRQTPIGPYIADFYCEAIKLVVEIDGGRHRLPGNTARDAERDSYMRAHGYRVCRVPYLLAIQEQETALDMIRACLKTAG